MVIFQSHVRLPEGLSLQLKSKMEGFGRFSETRNIRVENGLHGGIDLVDPESIQNPVAIKNLDKEIGTKSRTEVVSGS